MSGDSKKVKELQHYRENFEKGQELVQTLHQQGVYESIASIQKRAFSPVKNSHDDFIEAIRHLDTNYVHEGGLFAKDRELTRAETIKALFSNTLVIKPIWTKYQQLLKQKQQSLKQRQASVKQNDAAQTSAIKMVRQREDQLIKGVQKRLQNVLNELSKTLINKIELKVEC